MTEKTKLQPKDPDCVHCYPGHKLRTSLLFYPDRESQLCYWICAGCKRDLREDSDEYTLGFKPEREE